MALVIRYFSTTAAGAGDGTTWADRAALFSAGNWSSVVTGFNYTSDSLEARIGPGTYSCSQELAGGLITNDPTVATPLFLYGCDSSGNRLTPPDPDWVSAQPAWDDSGMPVIATTTNISTVNLNHTHLRLLKFTASGRTGGSVLGTGYASIDWCVIESSSSGTGAIGVYYGATRTVVRMTGSSFNWAFGLSAFNCRAEGVAGSSGSRRGFALGTAGINLVQCTSVGFGGYGAVSELTSGNQTAYIEKCVFAANTLGGVRFNSVAAQSGLHTLTGSIIVSNGGYGLDGQSGARCAVSKNRLRDNTSGNITGLGNFPDDNDNDVSAGTDAADFVDSTGGDYRIKYGSALWGKSIGAGDGPATITG